MKVLLLSLLLSVAALAQLPSSGAPVNQVEGLPGGPLIQTIPVVSGTVIVAVCYSPSKITTNQRYGNTVAISGISKANPGVVTSTGHGFDTNSRPLVTISGATGTGWITGVNGTFTATVIDANTFSIPVDTTGFGTLAGTVVFRTTAPRKTVAEWAVKKLAYDASSNVVFTGWLAGSDTYAAKCSEATLTTTNQQ